MKKIIAIGLILAAGVVAVAPLTNAQEMCSGTAKMCASHIIPPYVSDGQTYRSFILPGQDAEFHVTFFAGTTYRIAAGTGETEGNLIYSIYAYDPTTGDRPMIFTSAQHGNTPFWDFKVNATVEVAVVASLNPAYNKESGCAVVMIGFKQ